MNQHGKYLGHLVLKLSFRHTARQTHWTECCTWTTKGCCFAMLKCSLLLLLLLLYTVLNSA